MSQTHFDDVADVYDETLPSHVTEHYLQKRTRFVPGATMPTGAQPCAGEASSNSGESCARGLFKKPLRVQLADLPTVKAVGPRTESEGAARQ